MADQHNPNIPAVGNTILADIPDIKENLEFHKDAFQRIFKAWSDTDNSAAVIDMATGFGNGTYTVAFPTNGLANAKLMLGNGNTITWFYNAAAPPGWKALATGADMVLAVAGGAAAYNVTAGNPDSTATWTISGLVDDHTHTGPNHTHTGTTTDSYTFTGAVITAGAGGNSQIMGHTHPFTTGAGGTGNTSAASVRSVTHTPGWRPKASVGKLFQLG